MWVRLFHSELFRSASGSGALCPLGVPQKAASALRLQGDAGRSVPGWRSWGPLHSWSQAENSVGILGGLGHGAQAHAAVGRRQDPTSAKRCSSHRTPGFCWLVPRTVFCTPTPALCLVTCCVRSHTCAGSWTWGLACAAAGLRPCFSCPLKGLWGVGNVVPSSSCGVGRLRERRVGLAWCVERRFLDLSCGGEEEPASPGKRAAPSSVGRRVGGAAGPASRHLWPLCSCASPQCLHGLLTSTLGHALCPTLRQLCKRGVVF